MINLKSLENKRIKVRAIVDRITTKRGWEDHFVEIIIFKNILNVKGDILKIDCEMNYGKRFKDKKLIEDDFITFFVNVKYDENIGEYKFINPTNIGFIKKNKRNENSEIKSELYKDDGDLIYILQNRKGINEEMINKMKNINDYGKIITLYKTIKKQILFKEIFTIRKLLRVISNLSEKRKILLCESNSIVRDNLDEILSRV
jgi:hypothetical protein